MPADRITIARALRHRQTSAEETLWRELRARRLDGWKFRRQAPLGRSVADFACPEARLVIEVDGAHHESQIAEDAARTDILKRQGFLELRFTNEEVLTRLDWVLTEIRRALDIARQRPMRPAAPRWTGQ